MRQRESLHALVDTFGDIEQRAEAFAERIAQLRGDIVGVAGVGLGELLAEDGLGIGDRRGVPGCEVVGDAADAEQGSSPGWPR
jgi:hypothetical protein